MLIAAALIACSGPAAVAPVTVADPMLAPVPHPGDAPKVAAVPAGWSGHMEPDASNLMVEAPTGGGGGRGWLSCPAARPASR